VREKLINLWIYEYLGGNMTTPDLNSMELRKVINMLFVAYRDAMRIAIDLADGSYAEDVYQFLSDLSKDSVDIADAIKFAIETISERCGISVPPEVQQEIERLDREYNKLTE
jgi:hypothetical protein